MCVRADFEGHRTSILGYHGQSAIVGTQGDTIVYGHYEFEVLFRKAVYFSKG